MPLYLDPAEGETRATSNRLMAAVESFVGWMLGRQHDADVCFSLGKLPRFAIGESNNEGVQR